MSKLFLFVGVLLWATTAGFAQEGEQSFKPHGKPSIRIFSNYHTTFADGETEKAFELTRVYLGYEYFFSKNFSGKVIYDVGDPETGKHQLAAFVKNAELEYTTNKLSVNFGMISTTNFKVQENFWGYRYLLKSFQDEYRFAPSADLGVSVSYRFANWVNADFSVYNGEGYKKLDSDNILKSVVGLTLQPVTGLTVRGVYDRMGRNSCQHSWSGFVGFTAKKINVGAEYNYQENHCIVEAYEWSGPSFYATFIASEKIKLFARFDQFSVKNAIGATTGSPSSDGQLFLAGIEYVPVKGIKLAPNFRQWSPANSSLPGLTSILFNCEVNF